MAWGLRASAVTKVAQDSTPTYTLPTYVEGDILIGIVGCRAENTGYGWSGVGSSGWTELYSPIRGSYDYIAVCAKIATASETNPTFALTGSNVSTGVLMSFSGGPTTLTGILHASNSDYDSAGTDTEYATPGLTITQDNCLVIYAAVTNDDADWQLSGASLPNSSTGVCTADADVANDGTASDMCCLVSYAIQTTAANVGASAFNSGDATDAASWNSIAVALLAGAGQYFVKVLAAADAASATAVEGVVLNAARDTVIGEFSGQAFEADLEAGEAVLLIAANDITPDGGTLTTSDTPIVFAYNATDSLVGPADATVIEV